MKRAKRAVRLKPRNPLALDPLLGKGAAHQGRGKRGTRARQKQDWLKRAGRDVE